MIYLKDQLAFPTSNRHYPGFEYMFVFSKGTPKSVNLIADKKNRSEGRNITGSDRKADGSTTKRLGVENKKIPSHGVRYNYWLIYNQKRGIGHPAPFPFELARDHILSWSNEGDTVLDCFMGSRNDWTCRS